VDFLLWRNGKACGLIQVTQSLASKDTLEREKKALFSAMSELGINKAIILTEDEKLVLKEDRFYIDIQPIWLWLIT